MNRSAAIYLGEDRILMQPQDASPFGNFAGEAVCTLSHAASMEEVLNLLEQTLVQSRTLGEIPSNLKGLLNPLIAASGERTWNAISKAFAYVGVSEKNDRLTFFSGFPEKGAFLFRKEAHWRCSKQDREQVTVAFRAAASTACDAQNLSNPPPLGKPK
jgi:hypothetical protein